MRENTTLLIRADASTEMGTGHLMRCLALAQAWQERGLIRSSSSSVRPRKVVFVSNLREGPLYDRLRLEGVEVFSLPKAVSPHELQNGASDDTDFVIKVARETEAEWVVLDGYHFDLSYQEKLKKGFTHEDRSIMILDDAGFPHASPADFILNQNLYASESLYPGVQSHTRLLCGPLYTLLRREFCRLHKRARAIPEKAKKILVTLGGSDPKNLTLEVVRVLGSLKIKDLEVVVPVGGLLSKTAEQSLNALEDASRALALKISFERNVADIAPWMSWADLAISASGSTVWELAYLGLPALLFIVAENQIRLAQACHERGFAVNLGAPTFPFNADALAQALMRLIVSPSLRSTMSRQGILAIDDLGAHRVIEAMESVLCLDFKLRKVTLRDERQLWAWTNDFSVRGSSFSAQPISWEAHRQWLASKVSDADAPPCLFFMAENKKREAVGQVRFDLKNSRAVISVSVDPRFRGYGLGKKIIQESSSQVFREREDIDSIHAYVREENVASLHVFKRSGFIQKERVAIKGYKAVHFALKREWGRV